MGTSYKCQDCKDRGFVELFTTRARCRCQGRSAGEDKPDWVLAYESYEQYVRSTFDSAS